jgi:cytochrome c biogenesis protein CcmG/thiol:disulfide interchange protein DsbE
MLKLLILIPIVLFLSLVGLFWVGMQRDDPTALPSALQGQVVPSLSLTPVGDLPPLSDDLLRAPGVKLVNFWASWCAPCRAEHPILAEIAAQGIPIHGVNYKDDPAKAQAFLAELGNPYASIGADATGRTAIDWGLYGVPETFVIDGNGTVVLRFAGPITRQELDRKIQPAIDKARAAD